MAMLGLIPPIRRSQRCPRCDWRYPRRESECPHCKDLNDAALVELKDRANDRREGGRQLGTLMLGGAMVFLVIMAIVAIAGL